MANWSILCTFSITLLLSSACSGGQFLQCNGAPNASKLETARQILTRAFDQYDQITFLKYEEITEDTYEDCGNFVRVTFILKRIAGAMPTGPNEEYIIDLEKQKVISVQDI